MRVRNLDEVLSDLRGRDALLSTAHFGCWEYDSFLALYTGDHYVAAVYPSARKQGDRRRLPAAAPAAQHPPHPDEGDHPLLHRPPAARRCARQRIGIGLIADQNPPLRPNSHWFRFLRQDTVFFDGIEKMALKFRMPVYFCSQRRLRRGYYELEFRRLYDGEEAVPPNEITERYVRQLEKDIEAHPELWLWSHRRWKHRRPSCQS